MAWRPLAPLKHRGDPKPEAPDRTVQKWFRRCEGVILTVGYGVDEFIAIRRPTRRGCYGQGSAREGVSVISVRGFAPLDINVWEVAVPCRSEAQRLWDPLAEIGMWQ